MLKEVARRNGFHAQLLRAPKILDVVRNDETATGGDRTLKHHVVVRVTHDIHSRSTITIDGATCKPRRKD